ASLVAPRVPVTRPHPLRTPPSASDRAGGYGKPPAGSFERPSGDGGGVGGHRPPPPPSRGPAAAPGRARNLGRFIPGSIGHPVVRADSRHSLSFHRSGSRHPARFPS